MNEINKDRIIEDFATNLVRLGNECRDWAAECRMLSDKNKLLQAEVNSIHYTGLAVSMLREELAHKCHDNLEIRKAHQATVQMVRDLQSEVESLRKLGTEMGKHLPDTDEANRAYINFEAGGQS